MHDHLWINARLVTCADANDLQVIEDGALAARDGAIAWIGATDELPDAPAQFARRVTNVRGQTVLPGLIDCHTHLVFGGHRAAEYEQRLAGASYEEIARSGGGIASTVAATRRASDEQLLASAIHRAQQMLAEGVTCVEIKSGYGLTLEHEARMLRVARRLGRELPLKVVTTFLGAHALPDEFAGDRDGYIELVCREMLPALADEGLVDAVDGFCESIGFSVAEIERVFEAAAALDLPVKLHAEQLSNCGGTALAARYGALSVDHLEYLDTSGVAAIAASGTVAVLLPGAYHTLRDSRPPPVDLLRQHSVPMAVASDANPGTSPVLSLRLMTNLACQLFGLTVTEAIRGVTVNAARALGLSAERGSLAVGNRADMVICEIDTPAELPYWLGGRIVESVVAGGEVLDI